tara:strand:- start:127766 stop:128326 length:561 start_codon:yes stop_codon:yes gene_type:complete
MKFLKKNLSNILFAVFILLLLIPQTRMPIQVFLQRLIAFSPSTISEDKREAVATYDWQLNSIDDGQINFSTSEGEVILVNLWATWCAPCVAEMPSLQKLYNDYGDKMAFYFISNEIENKLNAFLKDNQYNLPVFQPLEPAPEALNSNALPTTYIIDKSGNIVIKKTGVADWNSKKTRDILDDLIGE